jgi:transcriptional regulator with XRE-family HTH domain
VSANSSVWARPLTDVLDRRPELTDDVLFKRSNISPKTIARVRQGGRISLDSADVLAIAMGYSLAQLYGEGEGEPTEEDRTLWAAHLAKEQARHNGRNHSNHARAS